MDLAFRPAWSREENAAARFRSHHVRCVAVQAQRSLFWESKRQVSVADVVLLVRIA